MSVKRNELESFQAYYRAPKARQRVPICPGCGARLTGIGFEDDDKCEDCIAIEMDLNT